MNKLKEKTAPVDADGFPLHLTPDQSIALVAKTLLQISASMDAFAFILERWALKNGVVTESDLEAGN